MLAPALTGRQSPHTHLGRQACEPPAQVAHAHGEGLEHGALGGRLARLGRSGAHLHMHARAPKRVMRLPELEPNNQIQCQGSGRLIRLYYIPMVGQP